MGESLVEVYPMDDYRLEMVFRNGSTAVVNLEKRTRSLRFSKLTLPGLFKTAKADGDRIIWSDGKETVSAYVNEILDSMMLD